MVHVSDDYTLAIKSSVGLNFNQMRRTKRILKEMGVSFDSETKERMKRKHILKDRIRAENVIGEEKTSKGKIRYVERTIVYVTDLCSFVFKRLDEMN